MIGKLLHRGCLKLIACALLGICLMAPLRASAENYPSKPIRLLLGYPAGGGMDALGRIIGQKLAENLGTSIVVENRPGATGTIAAVAVAQAAPDGYTLLFGETGFLLTPLLFAELPFDLKKSFVPISNVATLPLAFVVTNSFPAKTTKELVAAIKASPGRYNYGTAGVGTVHHIAFEQFKRATDIDAVHVPYKGGATLVPDLIAGRIEIGVLSSSVVAPLGRAGSARIIAVTSSDRPSNLPDVPTVAETISGFDMAPRTWLAAPAGTPEAIVAKIRAAVAKALKSKDVQEGFIKQGAIVASADGPLDLGTESARWIEIARSVGVKPQ